MRLSKVLEVKKRKLRGRIFTLGVIITGALSITFAIITFYGQNAGNFVMSLDYDAYNRGIVLATNEEFNNPSPSLMTEPIEEARDITYSWLNLDAVVNTDGNYVDPYYDYVAYTFYIKNDGFETVDVNYQILITEATNNIEAAIRVLVIEDGQEMMYQKIDEVQPNGELPYYPQLMPMTKHFVNDKTIAEEVFTKFEPGQYKKFSILVWLEGYDPDTSDDVLNGRIKLNMRFAIDIPE